MAKTHVSDEIDRAATEASAERSADVAVEPEFEKKFLALVAISRYDVFPASSTTQMVAHPAYLQIIGLGRAVLPYLLDELARQPDHWFYALSAITGEDPVPPNAEGNLAAMTAKANHQEATRDRAEGDAAPRRCS